MEQVMKTIAIVRVNWHNDYCHEGYVSSADPELQAGVQWKEVSEEELQEIHAFIRENQYDNYPNEARYVVIEKVDSSCFYSEFEAWKEAKRAAEERLERKREKARQAAQNKAERIKYKKMKEARKLLGLDD
jgi:hypothetical protein